LYYNARRTCKGADKEGVRGKSEEEEERRMLSM